MVIGPRPGHQHIPVSWAQRLVQGWPRDPSRTNEIQRSDLYPSVWDRHSLLSVLERGGEARSLEVSRTTAEDRVNR
jgi:hypothetical protein